MLFRNFGGEVKNVRGKLTGLAGANFAIARIMVAWGFVICMLLILRSWQNRDGVCSRGIQASFRIFLKESIIPILPFGMHLAQGLHHGPAAGVA